MKPKSLKVGVIAILLILSPLNLLCQGVADTLNIQGLNQFHIISSKARGKAGVNSAEFYGSVSLFYNPALLIKAKNVEISVGGGIENYKYNQQQDWYPNRLYAELSLIFENEETVVTKPFDDIKPDWKLNRNKMLLDHISGVIPVSSLRLGFGIAKVIDLDHYFQNNNALDPNIGQFRPEPVPRVQPGESLMVNWFQFVRDRKGDIYGIFGGFSYEIFKNLSIGLAISYLYGNSNDYQRRLDRGLFTFKHNNVFTLDSVKYICEKSGNSKYRGYMLIAGLSYSNEKFSAGFVIKPVVNIKRSWSYDVRIIDGNNSLSYSESDDDEIKIGEVVSAGFSLNPFPKTSISADYEMRFYGNTRYKINNENFKPWLNSSVLKFGFGYKFNSFEIGFGYSEVKDVVSSVGGGLTDKPIEGSLYSLVLSIPYGNVIANLSIGYTTVKYNDLWLSNVNYNGKNKLTLGIDFEIKI